MQNVLPEAGRDYSQLKDKGTGLYTGAFFFALKCKQEHFQAARRLWTTESNTHRYEEITMKNKNTHIIFSLVLILMLSACGTRASATPAPLLQAYGSAPSNENAALPTAPALLDASKGVVAGSAPADTSAQDRLVIMNADLTIVIPDPKLKLEAIAQLASDLGGFVVSENMYQTSLQNGGTAPEGSISIRVPSGKLDVASARSKVMQSRYAMRTATVRM